MREATIVFTGLPNSTFLQPPYRPGALVAVQRSCACSRHVYWHVAGHSGYRIAKNLALSPEEAFRRAVSCTPIIMAQAAERCCWVPTRPSALHRDSLKTSSCTVSISKTVPDCVLTAVGSQCEEEGISFTNPSPEDGEDDEDWEDIQEEMEDFWMREPKVSLASP